jgi:CubicO group peptidase (beta-lactamase class C family)
LDLTNEHNPYKNYGEKALNEYLENMLKLESEPAKVYSYSNLGAGLLGYTLGVSQKTSFQKLLQDRIFEKFRMTNSFTSSNNLNNSLVKGLNSNGEIVSNWDFDALFGAGGILSSTEDLAKFAKAQLNPKNRELALSRKPTFNVNEKMEIGLGWHILKSENDKELFWHNGGTAGYSSSIAINLEGRNAVIILSNVSAFNPKMKNIDNLCFELIGTLENK